MVGPYCAVNPFIEIQVAVFDVNEERGKEVESTFEEKYGTECIKFIRCDVSVESDLKGNVNFTPTKT